MEETMLRRDEEATGAMSTDDNDKSFFPFMLVAGGLIAAFSICLGIMATKTYLQEVDIGESDLEYLAQLGSDKANVLKTIEALYFYRSLSEYLKIFFPLSAFLLVSLGATLGSFYVQIRVRDVTSGAVDEMESRLLQAVDGRIDELAGEKVKEVKVQTARSLNEVYRSLSINRFESSKYDLAAHYMAKAIGYVDDVIALAPPDVDDFKLHRFHFDSELHYYKAASFQESRDQGLGFEALTFARAMPAHMRKYEKQKRANKSHVGFCDNYVYIVARTWELANADDRKEWTEVYEKERDGILKHLSQADDKPIRVLYEELYSEFKNAGSAGDKSEAEVDS